jgi:polysaccharide pyruvyl transferase WcaK-like protein
VKQLSEIRWGQGRPRVIVSDGWFANTGDAAIALAVDRIVRRAAPAAEVVHAAYFPSPVGVRLDLTVAPPLDQLLSGRFARDPGLGTAGRQFVAGADLVVSQGGGFLLEHYRPLSRIEALATVADLGVPWCVAGQTIGRFSDAATRRQLRRALDAAVMIGLRDRSSVHNVTDLSVRSDQVILGSDLGFELLGEEQAEAERRHVGVVVTNTNVRYGSPALELASAIVSDVLTLTADDVTLFSSVQAVESSGVENDLPFARAVLERIHPTHRGRVRLMTNAVDVHDLLDLVAKFRAVVSMRLHPALLAMAAGTPAALFLDAPKVGCLEGADVPLSVDLSDAEDRHSILSRVLDDQAPSGARLRSELARPRERARALANELARVVQSVA